jgi:apolipoprotein N-acyltransferase
MFELIRTKGGKSFSEAGGNKRSSVRQIGIALFILLLPIAISYLMLTQEATLTAKGQVKENVIIVQPNIDPYNEKFITGNTESIIQKMITQSEEGIDSNTKLVIWPETAVPVAVWQDRLRENLYYRPIFDFVNRHPQLTLVSGVETYKNYGTSKETNTARKNESDGTYYDAFNASVAISINQPLQFYNKSKLVPGVETLPDFLLWLGAIFEHFGGTTGGYGKDKEASVFSMPGNPYKVAPIICYESIYGEYIAEYVRKGANLLVIMTNDGWWANTPGHKQHLNYARLHAIETRKWIARSANTGISAVIDDKGNLLETQPWEKTAIIKYNIPPSEAETFFVRHGDLISPVAITIMLIIVAWNLWLVINKRLLKRRNKKVVIGSK